MDLHEHENPVPQETSGNPMQGSMPNAQTDAAAFQNHPQTASVYTAQQSTSAHPYYQAAYGAPSSMQYYGSPSGSSAVYQKKSHTGRTVFFTLLSAMLAFAFGCALMFGMIYTGVLDDAVSFFRGSSESMAGEQDEKPDPPDSPEENMPADQPEESVPDETTPGLPEEELPTDSFVPVKDAPMLQIVTVEPEGENYREELTIPDIADLATPSVVGVIKYASDNPMDGYGIGSGIIFTSDGYIITNEHVVHDAYSLTVLLHDGTEYEAQIIASDSDADVAVVKIDTEGLVPAEFGDSRQLRVGEISVAIGCPASIDLQGTTTSGIISALDRVITVDSSGRTMRLLQTDAAINPGNSGGPLLNKYGQVIGINTVKLTSSTYEGLCFAIPTSELESIISDLFTYGYVRGYPAIGITASTVWESADGSTPTGVLVATVDPLSGAYGKVEPGDIITHCNGTEVYAVAQINTIKNRLRVGESITLTVFRNGETFDVEIELKDQYDLSE